MTPHQYALYLTRLINEDADPNRSTQDLADRLYGYFQCFMPDGRGAEQTFAPLPDGDVYWQRLRPIYAAAEPRFTAAQAQNAVPGYFVPPSLDDTARQQALGQQMLDNMRHFADFLGDTELSRGLQQLTGVRLSEEMPEHDDPLQELWYEAFGDWRINNTDHDSLLAVLDEAYYSINCDYQLAAYFQYPAFRRRPERDFLRPYFELWQRGCGYTIVGEHLVVYPFDSQS